MKILGRFICCLLAFIFITSPVYVSSAATFYDVDEADAEKVGMVTDLGFLYYDLVPYFSPNKIITRKEAAEIMYILDKGYFYNDGGASYINNFKDVYKNDYVINFCRENGLIRGYEDNTFRPNNPITYAEIIEMFVKTLGFEDERILEYPDEYIKVAGYNGLLNDIEFKKEDVVTNLNAAKLVFNALTLPLYPNKNKPNLQATRFAELYKLTLQTNNRIERMLVMYEEFSDDTDMVLLNLDMEMILTCYKELSAQNINCEFKYNYSVQFLRKINGYVNTISKLKNEMNELDGMPVYLNFTRYQALATELYDCLMLLDAEMNYDDRLSGIMLNIIYTMLDKYEELIAGIETKLPTDEHFAASFSELEKIVLKAFDEKFISNSIPPNFYEEDNWINELIDSYNKTEEFYNFMTEYDLLEDYSYYDKMLELTYIIRSVYFIIGYEYSKTTEVENESGLVGEFFEASLELYSEIKQGEFIYYNEQIKNLIRKFDTLSATVL